MIGGALVGTFLGVLLAYCLVGPLASKLLRQFPLSLLDGVLLLRQQPIIRDLGEVVQAVA